MTADTDTDSNRETELKLSVRPEDLAVLRAAPVPGGRGRAVTRTLESVYFDTADRRLSKRRVTLRVRKQDDRYVQTVKSAPSPDSGLTRGEWEVPVAGGVPDLSALTDPEALAQLGMVGDADLRPVFHATIHRTTRTVRGGDGATASTVEVAFDEGEIRLPDGTTLAVAEVELELKEGDGAALFRLAGELARAAPLRLETRTKAARGFALAEGTADGPVKADKVELEADATVEVALGRILRSCLFHAAANEACTLIGRDPEGVHQMRVALRRLRSALALFRPFLPAEDLAWTVGEVKWIGGVLGEARDWDVFLTELLAPVRAGIADSNGHGRPLVRDLDGLESMVNARREQAYTAVREAILSPRYSAFQLRLGGWLEGRGWRAQPVSERSARLFRPVTELADELLDRRHRKARKAGRGFAHLSVDDRHQLRIALKKLRYAAEFFRTLYDDKAARRYTQQLAAFQDQLGHLNDVATATRLMHGLHEDGSPTPPEEARAAGIVIGWHARGIAELEPHLLEAWDGFAAAKPFWSRPTPAE
ncbi:CYTH and CHAD domain-containing protein [Azospirillum halopraeferens]|uniref:CYTH and CHAD domain-containing protein n=1 Tax=Azospirillum halopraeferens TaxID=34010 RepID=UPI0004104F54|nr:CYTH and CHAD domain-containing protein [Azospirillum halopraeferens]